MDELLKGFFAGMASTAAITGYIAADSYQSYRIRRLNDEGLIKRTLDFMAAHSYEELLTSREIDLPKSLLDVMRDWRLYRYHKLEDAKRRYPSALYEAMIKEAEKITPIGPISFIAKKLNLRSMKRKLGRTYGLRS